MGVDDSKKIDLGKAGASLGGLFGGLGTLIERLGELAEAGEKLKQSGEFSSKDGEIRGVYGFNVRVGIGEDNKNNVKVEPFGNIRERDDGGPVVDEVREPLVDLFDEDDHVLVLAEMPGVGEGDIKVELAGDILTISAESGQRKYRREVLLPQAFTQEQLSTRSQNGVFEIKLTK